MIDRNQKSLLQNRRDFLRLGSVTIASCFIFSAGCSAPATKTPKRTSTRRAFEYGVASADPQPNAVMLWSRVTPLGREEFSADVIVQMSKSDNFENVVMEKTVVARQNHDHTMRVFVKDLEPDTTYYYRFIASDGAISRTGRTWTAPPLDSDKKLVVALASCQAYPPSQYGAYRHLINEEKRTGVRPDMVLHVGDYVYGIADNIIDPETGLSGPIPGKPVDTGPGPGSAAPPLPGSEDRMGARRGPPPGRAAGGAAPGGAGGGRPRRGASSALDSFDDALKDKRGIYKAYHLDVDLQEARALYPFVCTWDDHEFDNDIWQSYNGNQANQEGRLAATQAWFEYVPQILSGSLALDGMDNPAKDYKAPEGGVKNTPMRTFDENFLATEPNNLKAVNAMTSYRAIRWGQRADIVITDTRSYRSPGANPTITLSTIRGEASGESAFGGFSLYEGEAVYQMSLGRTANDESPKDKLLVGGKLIDNPRKDAPATTMLGQEQKKWLKTALNVSNAKWKIWAVASPLTSFRFNPEAVKAGTGNGYNWTDGWDGYPNEREELMSFIWDEKIENVVSLTGDRHAHYASLVADFADKPDAKYVVPEYTCTGISAFPRWTNMYRSFERLGIADYAKIEKDGKKVVTMDMTMRYGFPATKAYLDGNIDKAMELAKDTPNPHLDFADNDAYGYVIATFNPEAVDVEFVTVPIKNWDMQALPEGPDASRTVYYTTPQWSGGTQPQVIRTGFKGEKLFGDV